MYPVLITGSMVMLRELTEADTAALHDVFGNDEATRHLGVESRSMEQVAGIIGAAVRSAGADPRTEYMLALAGTEDELVGSARLATGRHESAMISFALRPGQWGQGKGVETVRLLQRLGFTELGLHRIWGARSPLNVASARTMRAAGMIEEGTIRGHLYTRGAWRDSIVHSILREEFDGQQPQTCRRPGSTSHVPAPPVADELRHQVLTDAPLPPNLNSPLGTGGPASAPRGARKQP
jgi:RimJ/RimL family protein N-acetyltransferase